MRRFQNLLATLVLVAVATFAGVTTPAEAQDPSYRVIVHASNPASEISKSELARIFLKKRTTWDSGKQVVVVDQAERSSTRARFSMAVLGKDVPTMKSYWQQSLFSGRGVPPVEQGSDGQVAAFVAANETAIGYVSAAATLPPGVKVIEIATR